MILFEVHHNGLHTIVKLQQFIRFGLVQAKDTDNAIAHLQDRAYLFQLDLVLNLL